LFSLSFFVIVFVIERKITFPIISPDLAKIYTNMYFRTKNNDKHKDFSKQKTTDDSAVIFSNKYGKTVY